MRCASSPTSPSRSTLLRQPRRASAIISAPGFDHGATSHASRVHGDLRRHRDGPHDVRPAVTNPWWPWPGLDVHVLTSRPLPDRSSRVRSSPTTARRPARRAARARYQRTIHCSAAPARSRPCSSSRRRPPARPRRPALYGAGLPFAHGTGSSRPLRLEDTTSTTTERWPGVRPGLSGRFVSGTWADAREPHARADRFAALDQRSPRRGRLRGDVCAAASTLKKDCSQARSAWPPRRAWPCACR